jgi:hypothetical protein
LLGDVVSEFCDTDKSALSHRCFPPLGLFHIATQLCNRARRLRFALAWQWQRGLREG